MPSSLIEKASKTPLKVKNDVRQRTGKREGIITEPQSLIPLETPFKTQL